MFKFTKRGTYNMISQGAKANIAGAQLESQCEAVFSAFGMEFTSQANFTDCYNNSRSRMDFYLPSLDCAVECKRQNVSGTADQKLPFVLENLALFPARRGLLILDGTHYENKQGIIQYLCTKQSEVFDWCFFYELEDWLGGQ